MTTPDLSTEEFEQLALFALGLAIGVILISLALDLLEEWIVSADLADRRSIREVLQEMLEQPRPKASSTEAPQPSILTASASE